MSRSGTGGGSRSGSEEQGSAHPGGRRSTPQGRSGQGHQALLHPVVLEYESSRSTMKTRFEPAGINGEGDWLP